MQTLHSLLNDKKPLVSSYLNTQVSYNVDVFPLANVSFVLHEKTRGRQKKTSNIYIMLFPGNFEMFQLSSAHKKLYSCKKELLSL